MYLDFQVSLFSFQIQQFLSDVGGAIGLWIGLSILSLCELVQLFVELFDYGIYKVTMETDKGRKQRRKARTNLSIVAANGNASKDKNSLPRNQLRNCPDNSRYDYDARYKDHAYTGNEVIYGNQWRNR